MTPISAHRTDPFAAQRRDPIGIIIAACAAEWGVTDAAIRGNSRRPSAVRPRHAAIWIAKQVTGRSTTELGEAFARDHTSILHALGRIDHADPETRAAIARVRERLEPGISMSRMRAETMDRAQIAALGEAHRVIEETVSRSIKPALEEMGRIGSKAGAEILKLLADIGEGS